MLELKKEAGRKPIDYCISVHCKNSIIVTIQQLNLVTHKSVMKPFSVGEIGHIRLLCLLLILAMRTFCIFVQTLLATKNL